MMKTNIFSYQLAHIRSRELVCSSEIDFFFVGITWSAYTSLKVLTKQFDLLIYPKKSFNVINNNQLIKFVWSRN